jgi:hypothetical protein
MTRWHVWSMRKKTSRTTSRPSSSAPMLPCVLGFRRRCGSSLAGRQADLRRWHHQARGAAVDVVKDIQERASGTPHHLSRPSRFFCGGAMTTLSCCASSSSHRCWKNA